ncbi:MAG TPA: sigma 54-interacting transcriptional regulator [Acidobacteriaceae bacterium]
MPPRLVAISGPFAGIVHPLSGEELLIGRESSSGFCLADHLVSRKHCLVRQADDLYELADLGSHNGTFVNGVPVLRKVLAEGDTIRIGSSELLFLVRDEDGLSLAGMTDETTALDLKPVSIEGAPRWSGVDVGHMARDLAVLFRISNVIASVRDLHQLQSELLQLIFEVIPAEQGAILLMPNPNDDAASVCSWSRHGVRAPAVKVQRDIVHRAMWERTAILGRTDTPSGEAQNVLCVPLLATEKTLGVLYLTAPESVPLSEEHIYLLNPISRIAAVTLENRVAMDALRSENRQMQEQVHSSQLIGESRPIAQVRDFIGRVAQADSTVLIRGESGTGKEVVARGIHHASPRAAKPFIAINCAAIPEALLESELFGHERGAFTGAVALKKGKLELAEDGTVFLDEIGEMAPLLQAKLLRVLQQREFERVGGSRCLAFAARVVAATNKNLDQAIKAGEFRQDLYYRLNVVSVVVPPLREHRDDIPLLTLYFASKYAAQRKRPFTGISSEARALLMNYSWPGNVRELENAIEHAMVLGLTEEILPEDLPTAVLEEQPAELEGTRYYSVLNGAKKELLQEALRHAGGNYPEAAKLLGIHPKYLHRLARNLKIKPAAV